jgi:hypothetical protein
MEKVMMLIWQFRDDPNVVQFMAQFVAKVRSIEPSMLCGFAVIATLYCIGVYSNGMIQ